MDRNAGAVNTSLRVAPYGRVSTQEQAQKKTSIPQQIRDCHKVILEKGWIFFQEYTDEGVSGHLTEERHGLQSMMRDAREHKFDLIIVKDYDRFARNKDAAAIIRQELKGLGIQTYSINTPVEPKSVSEYDPDDNDSATIMETISDMKADLERTAINRRMKGGKMIKAKEGKIPNRVPYGYKVVRTLEGNKIKRTVIVDEDEAQKIRFIFNEYARGNGDRKIAIEMNKKGWSAPNGINWSIQTIRYILANPTYTGKVWWGWRHADYKKNKEWQRRGKVGYVGNGEHSPIVDETIFNLVKEIRAGRTKHAKGGAGRSLGVLTGIAKCIRCKSGVGYQKRRHKRSDKNPKWKDTTTFEYICTGYKYKGICSQRVMSADKLEGAVLDHIKNLYSHPKVQENITYTAGNQEENDREKTIARLNRDIESGPAREQRHQEAYEKGVETLEQLDAHISRIRQEIQKSRVEVERLSLLSTTTAQKVAVTRKLVASLKDFDACWDKMELDEKKMILRSIIKEIRAGDNKVEIDFIF
ncbi:MAG: recombinase family protein [bacterium]